METYELRVRVNDLRNAFTSESLFSESPLDVVEDLSMCRVRLIEDILQVEVGGPKAVAEVLCKYPATVLGIRVNDVELMIATEDTYRHR